MSTKEYNVRLDYGLGGETIISASDMDAALESALDWAEEGDWGEDGAVILVQVRGETHNDWVDCFLVITGKNVQPDKNTGRYTYYSPDGGIRQGVVPHRVIRD